MKWQVKNLGDLTKIRTGKLDANAASENGKYPFFTCAIKPLLIDHFAYDTEAVIVAGNGDLNVKYYEGKFNAYQRTYIVESSDKSILLPKYLYHFLDLYLDTLRAQSIGGVIKYIKLNNLTDAKIPLPPLPEQNRIADILDRADALRAKRLQAIEKINTLGQAIFLEMFGAACEKMSSKNNTILENVGDFQGGLQVTTARTRYSVEVPYLRVANVFRDRLELSEIKTIRVTESELERTRLSRGDVLFVEGHGNAQEIGRCAVWDGSVDEIVHQNHLIRLRVNQNIALPEYISFYMNSPLGRRDLLRQSKTTSGLNTLSIKNVKQASIAIPSLEDQREFVARLSGIEHCRNKFSEFELKSSELSSALETAFFG